jgi:hypothetical protein
MNTLLAFTDSELREFLDVALFPILLTILVVGLVKAFTE